MRSGIIWIIINQANLELSSNKAKLKHRLDDLVKCQGAKLWVAVVKELNNLTEAQKQELKRSADFYGHGDSGQSDNGHAGSEGGHHNY